ncbi:MAG: hypothetical protein E7277_08940 [Lachnospiraceae bacterium]|nr:hypothetical protein [Lachnospiraceae bacterium]
MRIEDNLGGIQFQCVKSSRQRDWKLTDSLAKQISALAKQDAQKAIYMDKDYIKLQNAELAKVAPNREELKAKATMAINQTGGNRVNNDYDEEEDLVTILLGLPYKAKFEAGSHGNYIHIFDENGDQILSYTPFSGWHSWPTKEEQMAGRTMTDYYHSEYCAARKNCTINNELGEMPRASFDVRA